MLRRPRILWIPARVDFGPYRSLERVEHQTRQAIADHFELVELDAHPGADPEAFLDAFRKATPIDAVVDQSDHALHGPLSGPVPTLFHALGGMPNGATFPWLRRSRLKTHDVMLLNCQSDLEIYRRALGDSGPVAELLPFGVDVDHFRPRDSEERRKTRDALGIDANAFVVLYAGRLNIQKNLHSLFYALRETVARVPSIRLVLAGEFDRIAHTLFDATNDGYEALLRGLLDQWGLTEYVLFAGNLDDDRLSRLYAAADVFATLTLHNNENFGYAAVEAMASGLPVIASHFGGLKDTVIDGVTGFHVETAMTDHGLRAAWRQALAPLWRLAEDRELRGRMSLAATEHVRKNLSVVRFGDRLAEIVSRAMERPLRGVAASGSHFQFAPEAMQLHMRNLYRTYRRAEGLPKAERRGPRVEYESYRWFQAPYATFDIARVPLEESSRLVLVTRCRLDRRAGTLSSLDPIWPRVYPLEAAEFDTLAGLEPGVSLSELIDRGTSHGLERERILALVTQLYREGVVFPDREFQAPAV